MQINVQNLRLKPGNVIPGLAIGEEPGTSLVVPEGFHGSIDEYGNYILRRA